MNAQNVLALAQTCLAARDPDEKCRLTEVASNVIREHTCVIESTEPPQPIDEPGRPDLPELIDPAAVPRRKLGHAEGRAALLHAIAHIEFNAINLAWDAVYRFRGMPRAYYEDWARVAAEEAYHFQLLRDRLRELGYDYGAFAAHNGLWEMAQKTAHDVLARMALVPRVLEARGLDVTPGMMRRLQQAGDTRTVELLEIILRDEIGHVAIGTRWFSYCCEQRGIDREVTFEQLVLQYVASRGKRPIDRVARTAAGFSEREMSFIESGMGEFN